MLPTSQFVQKVLSLSLFDPVYQDIPEQLKSAYYTEVCNEFNIAIQIVGKNLVSGYFRTFTNYTTNEGYAVIDTTLGDTVDGGWTVSTVTFQFNIQNYPLKWKDNDDFMRSMPLLTIPGYPSTWTWHVPTQSIWIYPIPVVGGTFRTLIRPLLPSLSVSSGPTYVFTPSTIDFPTENNFLDYLTFYLAERMCINHNAPFSSEKQNKLKELGAQLVGNKQLNCKLNTLAVQCTQVRECAPFPYFYYLSGGGPQ